MAGLDGSILSLKQVSVSYGDAPVLHDVEMQLRPAEFVSLIGPSGCGKSTLLKVIAGLLRPTCGIIRQNSGHPGYMPQRDCLMPWRTVAENAGILLEVTGQSRRVAAKEAEARLVDFGLEGCGHLYPHQLSGGMRQRVAFLRTVLGAADLVLLDEPFGALDALTRADMQEWLLNLWQRLNITVLFVTHDVEEAVLLSDRVLVLAGKPAGIREAVQVDCARPRSRDMVTRSEFLWHREHLLRCLRDGAAPAEKHRVSTGSQRS